MGRVTVFVRQNCPFCERARTLLEEAVATVLEEQRAADAARPKSVFKPPPTPTLEILYLDVGKDAALAAQCIRLTSARTVPQVFVNEKHLGNFRTCSKLKTCGNLTKELARACRVDTNFPPEPEAAMVKVTDELAFSSMPTPGQVKGLHSFGFRAVINVCHASQCLATRLEEEQNLAEAAGLTYFYVPPTDCAPAPAPGSPSVRGAVSSGSDDDDAGAGSGGDGEGNPAAGAGSGAGAGGGAERKSGGGGDGDGNVDGDAGGTAGDPRLPIGKAGQAMDAGGPVKHTREGTESLRAFLYDRSWVQKVLCAIYRAEKPVLVHGLSGVASCAVVLLRAALQMRGSVEQIVRWGRDLGHDLTLEVTLLRSVSTALDKAQAHYEAARGDVAESALCSGRSSEAGAGAGDGSDSRSHSPAATPRSHKSQACASIPEGGDDEGETEGGDGGGGGGDDGHASDSKRAASGEAEADSEAPGVQA